MNKQQQIDQQLEIDEELAEEEEEGEEDQDEQDDGLDDVNLTDEEREAMRESDEDEQEHDDDDAPPIDEAQESDNQAEEADSSEDAGQEPDTAQQQDQVAADQAPAPAPTPVVDEGPTYDEQLASIEEARIALKNDYDMGDIDTVEFIDKREALSKQETQLEWTQRETKIHSDIAEQEDSKNWEIANKEFFKENPTYENNNSLKRALQGSYNDVHNDPAFAGVSYAARLREAKARMDKDLGVLSKAPQPTPDPKDADAAKRAAMKGRGKQVGKVPLNVGDLPPADTTTPESGGKYAYLEDLGGVELERAIASMSEDEADAWRESAH